jgi:hypothetical protein
VSTKQMDAATLLADLAAHRLTVKRDDQTYRHLSFRGSEPNAWNMWFDIVTWPNCLTINGDMGTWTFCRVEDMFTFFRSKELTINASYWSEKICSESRFGGPHRKFSPEHYKTRVFRALTDYGLDAAKKRDVLQSLEGTFSETEECEAEMRRAVRDFEYYGFEFSDPWEIDGEDYTYHFIWCLFAIVWAIQQYDAAKEEKPDAL